MLNTIKAAATGIAFAAIMVGTGGLALIAMLVWQSWRDPFFDGRR